MSALLDINVLVALAWPNHMHHEAAHTWFARHRDEGWATCPISQVGFVRVSSNHSVFSFAKTPAEALTLLDQITGIAGHEFWSDEVDLTRTPHIQRSTVLDHRQIPDAHLLAIALSNSGRVATFDRGLKNLAPLGSENVVVEIP